MDAGKQSTRFLVRLIAAFALVIALLAAGVAGAIRRLDSLAGTRIAAIRAEENEITAVHRLRWSAELMVSAGRGYLVSGQEELAARLQSAANDFDANLERAKTGGLAPASGSLLHAVEQAADQFRRRQTELMAARSTGQNGEALAQRFEEELRPSRQLLAQALDRLVLEEEARLEEIYQQVARDRRSLMSSTWAALGLLVVLALAIASVFARTLLRAYRTEEEARARAQQALSARDELLSIVAHDLRSPLGAITMKAGALQRQTSAETIRKQAASIENVAVRMDFIIKSLLDVASLEAGKFSLTAAPCPVEALVQETADMFGGVAAAKSIVLDRSVGEPHLVVHADHERLLQVLSNLVGNAIKFTPPGGHIGIDVQRDGETARFSVSDTGPGITAEDRPHIFERFWKHEKQGSKGTGLGLFIARRIVEEHGGRIWVESEPGHGSVFIFVIPRVGAQRLAPAAIQPPTPGPRRLPGEPANRR